MQLQFKDIGRTMRGNFRVQVYRRGRLIETNEDHNLIVDGARTAMAQLIVDEALGKRITHIACGTNGATPAPDDTAITDAYIKPINSFSYPAPGQVEIAWSLSVSEANGLAIIEFGLVCADGTLFARKIRQQPRPLYKEDDISIDGQWTIIF